MIDFLKIKAISLDLDDTLWPVWPTIARAEETLALWLAEKAPKTVPLCAIAGYQRQIREAMPALRPDLGNDLSALRREAIRVLLERAGEDPSLAEPAFEVFFEARQKVIFLKMRFRPWTFSSPNTPWWRFPMAMPTFRRWA